MEAHSIVSSGRGASPCLRRSSRSNAPKSARSRRSAKKAAVYRRQLFRDGRGDELIYAYAIGFSAALDFCFNRAWQPKQISTLRILGHLILRNRAARRWPRVGWLRLRAPRDTDFHRFPFLEVIDPLQS